MSDKHLYDQKGDYVGRISDSAPSSSSRSDPKHNRQTAFAFWFAIVLAAASLFFGSGDGLNRILLVVASLFIGWIFSLFVGWVVNLFESVVNLFKSD